ncbi:sugar porter family MFS transporter [Microbacterium sp. Marseille-Q6965]|uniref:sugar porter family MFS transporter n=1 Tax=Microbacterium sp. Marseille-Q6965 TaxID=2965072 RepID=UPI0021B6E9E3|nr:sugar porter family MFS transporter [Microbacterium sp. Marseille-Q6965]
MNGTRAVVAVVSLLAAIVLGGALATVPTPLYGVYSAELGLDALGVTATFAVFACGAVGGLLAVAALSRALSRRRAYVAASVLQVAAAIVLGLDLGLPGFVAGRVLTGLGAGALAASGTAFLTEVASRLPGRARRALAAAAPAAAYLALGSGPLLGTLADFRSLAGVHALFLGIAAAIALALVVSLLALPCDAGAATNAPSARAALPPAAGLGAFAAFMTTGLFGSVTTAILAALGSADAAGAGALAGAVFVAGACGVAFLGPRLALRAAAVAAPVALCAVAAAVQLFAPAAFVVAALAAGAGSGALFARSLRVAVAAVPGAAFRQTSLVFACGYAGLAMPVLGLGAALRVLPLPAGLWCFGAVTAVVCGGAFALARR